MLNLISEIFYMYDYLLNYEYNLHIFIILYTLYFKIYVHLHIINNFKISASEKSQHFQKITKSQKNTKISKFASELFEGAGGVEAGLWDRVWRLCALPGSRH